MQGFNSRENQFIEIYDFNFLRKLHFTQFATSNSRNFQHFIGLADVSNNFKKKKKKKKKNHLQVTTSASTKL